MRLNIQPGIGQSCRSRSKTALCFCPSGPFCPKGWLQFNTSCYLVTRELTSWGRARQRCKSEGGDLVSINSRSEKTAIVAWARKLPRREVWTGLVLDPNNSSRWIWSDGSRPDFKIWPGNFVVGTLGPSRCVFQSSSFRLWHFQCDSNISFVCERKGELSTALLYSRADLLSSDVKQEPPAEGGVGGTQQEFQ